MMRLTIAVLVVACAAAATPHSTNATWRDDPGWFAGKAEWALYDATRPIYGIERAYEATIFTNHQHMDPALAVKSDVGGGRMVPVFKHNVSEIIPTGHYDYRFLTTSFVRADDLSVYKLTMSSQEDCGSTFKRFLRDGRRVEVETDCYFPGTGRASSSFNATRKLAFEDALSLTLRDFPFEQAADGDSASVTIDLVPDQTLARPTPRTPATATVTYIGEERLELPYGPVRAWHLRLDQRGSTADYWFSAEPGMRRAMVQYRGAHGVRYRLKALGWWAYWNQAEPRPDQVKNP